VLHIPNLPDPYGCYAGLIRSNPKLVTARVAVPDIYDRQGVYITLEDHDLKI
ncbi:hypothetical protein J3R82DRAFT_3620, partial [Butyriboletus roseoflavus]